MVPAASPAAPPSPGPTSTWERHGTRLGRTRLAAALLMLAFAAALATEDNLTRMLAALAAADVAIMSLPWRVPRASRSVRSILLENAAYQVMPLGALAAVLVSWPSWLSRAGAWWWYPVALLAGAALVAIGGTDLRMLLSGELAFLAGPRAKAHARAHVAGALAGPPGEEAVFRGVVFMTFGAAAVVTPVLAAVAFVARHHLPPGSAPRPRLLFTESAAAVLLLALTVASRSIYPAVVAHLVNNTPQALLEGQRGRMGGEG